MDEVKFDLSELEALKQKLGPELGYAVKSAYIQALRRALKSGESAVAKLYQESYSQVSQRFIKEKFVRTYANYSAKEIPDISAVLSVSGKGLFLEHLKPKKSAHGATYKAAGGKPVEVKGAFYAKVFSNNLSDHWWARVPGKYYKGRRETVKLVYGPSPYTMYKFPENQKRIGDIMHATLMREIAPQLSYYLNRAAARIVVKA